jgi:2-dehydropantoate 2-reductase
VSTVLVVGAGSLGTLYGAALARAGCDVQLLARPAHAEAIAAAGHVVVESGGEEWRVPLRATADPALVGPAGTVLLLTQAQDSEAALASVAHIRDGVTLAVSLQNGGGTERPLQAWCGAEPVAGGTSMVGATLLAPGRVAHTNPGLTFVGELDGSVSPRTTDLGARLEAGGLECVVTDRVRSAEWSKLVHAAATMTITALPRLPLHAAMIDAATACAELVREGGAVAAAAGVTLDDWPGMLPVATMCSASLDEATELVATRGREFAAAGATAIKVSMLRSIETGRRLELGPVHGYLCAEADRLGVEVPRLQLALDLLGAIDRSRL